MSKIPPEEILLYGGEIKLIYHETSHRYYLEEDGKKKLIPNVTTISGIGRTPDGLIQWAANMSVEHVRENLDIKMLLVNPNHLEEILQRARYAHKDKKESAAVVGRSAHEWLDTYFKSGIEPPYPEDDQAKRAVEAAMKWLDRRKVKKLFTEKRIYSRQHRYSGTLDKVAEVDGENAIVDWKTGKNIYPEARLQTAAYLFAEEEESGKRIDIRWLIHLDKETGEFGAYRFDRNDFDVDMTGFLAAKSLYDWQKKSKMTKTNDWIDQL